MKYLGEIFRRYRWSLLLIYFLIVICEVTYLFLWQILGLAIDGLLVGDYFYLGLLFGLNIFGNLFHYRRMVYDTRVYMRIYNDIVYSYLDRCGLDVSSKVARTEMAGDIVNFFENDVAYYIARFIHIVGCIYFIFYLKFDVGIVVLCSIIPIVIIVYKFYFKIGKVTSVIHNHMEFKVKVMESGDILDIRGFFERRRRLFEINSLLQAKHWFSLNIVRLVFLVVSIVVFTYSNYGLTQGQTISMYMYINEFLFSLMVIPVAVETFMRIKDVIKRISHDKIGD
jgi:hypothetical protein